MSAPDAKWRTHRRLLQFALRVLRHFGRNRGFLLASAVGYNALLSIIPLFAVVLVVLSHVVDEALLVDVVRTQLRSLLPVQADALTGAVSRFLAERDVVGALGFAVMFVFSLVAFRMLEAAMAAIFEHPLQPANRRFVVSVLIPLAYLGVFAVALLLLTLATTAMASSRFAEFFGRWHALENVGFFGLVILLASFYRVMPHVRVGWRASLVGGAVAAILWELLRRLIVWYLSHISVVNVLYGSFATAVVLLLSMEIFSIIILLGAQVIAELVKSRAYGLEWWEAPPEH